VACSCKYGDEPVGSSVTKLVSWPETVKLLSSVQVPFSGAFKSFARVV
jgi:hypothetical protein